MNEIYTDKNGRSYLINIYEPKEVENALNYSCKIKIVLEEKKSEEYVTTIEISLVTFDQSSIFNIEDRMQKTKDIASLYAKYLVEKKLKQNSPVKCQIDKIYPNSSITDIIEKLKKDLSDSSEKRIGFK